MLFSLYDRESVVFLPWNSLGTETLYSLNHPWISCSAGTSTLPEFPRCFSWNSPTVQFYISEKVLCRTQHNLKLRKRWLVWRTYLSSLIDLLFLSSWSDMLLLCRLARHTGSTPKVVNKQVSTTTKSICLHWLWVELTYKLFDTSLRIVSVKKHIVLHYCYILATFFSCYWVSRVQLHCTCSSGSKNMEKPLKKLIKNLELHVSILDEAVHLLPSTGCVKIVLYSLSI